MKKTIKPTQQTLSLLIELGEAMASYQDVAAMLGCDEDTLHLSFQRYPAAKKAYEEAKTRRSLALRQTQLKLAETNATMAIWLGKQYLGQHDKHEHSGPNGSAIRFEKIEHIIVDPQSDDTI